MSRVEGWCADLALQTDDTSRQHGKDSADPRPQMSVMGEQLLELPEMKAFTNLVGAAEDDYMPCVRDR
jgi:hypothetical protein